MIFVFINNKNYLRAAAEYFGSLFLTCLVLVLLAYYVDSGVSDLMRNRIMLFLLQFKFLLNFSGGFIQVDGGTLTTSFPSIYTRESISLVEFFKNHPVATIFGDGFKVKGGFPKGGDFAVVDLIATYGVPLFSAMVAVLVWRVRDLFFMHLSLIEIRDINLGLKYKYIRVSVIIFFVVSMLHYNLLLQKEIFLLFILFMSLPMSIMKENID